jgi:hypothetical protein
MAELPIIVDTRRTRLVAITSLRRMHRMLLLSICCNIAVLIWMAYKWQ